MPRFTPELAPKSSPFTIRYFMTSQGPSSGQRLAAVPLWLSMAQGVAQDLCRGLFGVEMGFGQSSRRLAVVLVISVDLVECPSRIHRCSVTSHSLAVGGVLSRARVVESDRSADR